MSENKITFPVKLASNNPQSFGIVDATEISGHRSVGALSDLYSISDPVLSILKDGSDAIGQEWLVVSEDCKYRLDNWENRGSAAGWTKLPKQELINIKQSVSEKDQPNGYAGLDSNGKVPIEKTYGTTATVVDVETYESLPVTGLNGVIYYVSNTGAQYKWSGSAYIDITDGADNAKKNETSIFDCSNGTSTKYYSSLSNAINVVPLVYKTSNRIISYLSVEYPQVELIVNKSATVDGSISIYLDGTLKSTISVTAGMTAIQIADKLSDLTYVDYAPWSWTDNGATNKFTLTYGNNNIAKKITSYSYTAESNEASELISFNILKEGFAPTAVNYQYSGVDNTTWTNLTKWQRIPNQADLVELRSDLSQVIGISSEKSTTSNTIELELPFLKVGNIIEYKVVPNFSYTSFYVATRSNAVVVQRIANAFIEVNTWKRITITEDANSFYVYSNGGVGDFSVIVRNYGAIPKIEDIETEIEILSEDIDGLQVATGVKKLHIEGDSIQSYVPCDFLKKGNIIEVVLNSVGNTPNVTFLTCNDTNVLEQVGRITCIGNRIVFEVSQDANVLYYYNNSGSSAIDINVSLFSEIQLNKEIVGSNNIRETITTKQKYINYQMYNGKSLDVVLTGSVSDNINIVCYLYGLDGSSKIIGSFYSVGESIHIDSLDKTYDRIYFYNNNEVSEFSIYASVDGLSNDVTLLQIDKDSANRDIASGGLDELSIANLPKEAFVAYKSIRCDKPVQRHQPRMVVAVNHDDLAESDYLGTRKIYNKYGFNANFNFILSPYYNTKTRDRAVKNIKKLVSDGNRLGFHSFPGGSYWLINKLYDYRPNGGRTYAPSRSEIKGSNADGTGINAFGQNITTSTTLGSLSLYEDDKMFWNLDSELANIKVVDVTDANWNDVLNTYCIISDKKKIDGVDIDGVFRSWTPLQWMEHWYNRLIDSSMGYSDANGMSYIYDRDYARPEGIDGNAIDNYYPNVAHLANGKIVRFDDTSNPNYNNAEYQKVGYFIRGFFKDCSTCCNYEVMSRVLETANAYCRHFFGIDHLDNYGKHGVRYARTTWKGADGLNYDNRYKTILSNEGAKVYSTLDRKFLSTYDVFLKNNIKITNHYWLWRGEIAGQNGLFLGCKDIRGSYFNNSNFISYLVLLGSYIGTSGGEMSYEKFMKFIAGHENNLLKWAYENAGRQITIDAESTYVQNYIKQVIDVIRGSVGTGKIPSLSVDTISPYPNVLSAVELLCQFCYQNDISIVPMEDARLIACDDRDLSGNLFPNPSFNQMLINMFGTSESTDAYLPDGWSRDEKGCTFDVVKENGVNTLAFTGGTSSNNMRTSIYGLKGGKYRFSAYVKTTNISRTPVIVSVQRNKDVYGLEGSDIVYSAPINSEYTLITCDIDIPNPISHAISDNAKSQILRGYDENNVVCVKVQLLVEANQTTYIHSPKLEYLVV